MIEKFPLAKVNKTCARRISGKTQLHLVLTM